jgi:hypothetical protein
LKEEEEQQQQLRLYMEYLFDFQSMLKDMKRACNHAHSKIKLSTSLSIAWPFLE